MNNDQSLLKCQLEKKPAIFVHIQKTAGTSMVDLFRRHYQEKQIISHGDYLSGVEHFSFNFWKINRKVISDFHNIRFLSGHFGYDFAKQFMPSRYSFTFLRDPVERVLSFYYFCRTRDPHEYDIYRLCHELTLDEFLKKGMEESRNQILHLE